jgi:hypothetical protein
MHDNNIIETIVLAKCFDFVACARLCFIVQNLRRECKLSFLRMGGVLDCDPTFSAFGMSADFMQKKSRHAFKSTFF